MGLAGTGRINTTTLLVTGAQLTVTVDILQPGGSLRVTVQGQPGLEASVAVGINTTDHVLVFPGERDLKSLIGQNVTLSIDMKVLLDLDH